MIVDPNEGLVGTVGGGCGEAEVIEAAQRVLRTGTPERVRLIEVDDDHPLSALVSTGDLVELVRQLAAAAKSST